MFHGIHCCNLGNDIAFVSFTRRIRVYNLTHCNLLGMWFALDIVLVLFPDQNEFVSRFLVWLMFYGLLLCVLILSLTCNICDLLNCNNCETEGFPDISIVCMLIS